MKTKSPSSVSQLVDVSQQTQQWLLNSQDPEGGWSSVEKAGTPSPLNTAEILIALIEANPGLSRDSTGPIQRARNFLINLQEQKGADAGSWDRASTPGVAPAPDIVRTAFITRALILSHGGKDSTQPIQNALKFFKDMQTTDGGWPLHRGGASTLLATATTLLALIKAEIYNFTDDDMRAMLDKGITALLGNFFNVQAGYFGRTVGLEAAHTVYGVMVLQELRTGLKIEKYQHQERQALDWLLANPEKALSLAEEYLVIQPSQRNKRSQNYPFFYTMDALLVRIFSVAGKEFMNNELGKMAMRSLTSKVDEQSGGVYGLHKYTWAAAYAIYALTPAQLHQQSLPSMKPQFRGLRGVPAHSVLLWVSIGILFISSALAAFGRFPEHLGPVILFLSTLVGVATKVIDHDTLLGGLKIFFHSST